MSSAPQARPDRSLPVQPAGFPWSMLVAFLAVAGAGLLLASYMQPQSGIPRMEGRSLVGQPLPPLDVEGWFNGDPPSVEQRAGQVLFIDAWAFWCGPCRRLAPELKELHAKYAPKGVQFIGLTSMDSETIEESRAFIANEGIPWPQGYGAVAPLLALEADAIPQVWIVGRDGKIVWDARSEESVETALDQALAAQTSASAAAP